MTEIDRRRRAGFLLGVGAYALWGVMPLYFKALAGVPATEIVAHRIVWSVLFLGLLATIARRWTAIRTAVTTPRVIMILIATALLIAVNWLVFIQAIQVGHALEASLGYYVFPLLAVAIGYFALGWLIWLGQAGSGGFGRFGLGTDALLVLGGAVTAVPLLLFTAAARRLPYSTLGFLQYIAPSLQFLLAVLAFGEPMTTAHIVCFAAIWTALVVFTLDGWRSARMRAAEPAV